MVTREISSELLELTNSYPVVTITGPRQAGKTTLSRMSFPNFNYSNLEHPEIRHLAETDPNAFFKQFKKPVIIDEIQRVPQLLSYIQVIVDENRKPGSFILTGSHQLSLSAAISQSLAGRTALLKLLPFSIKELSSQHVNTERDTLLTTGFLPRIYDQKLSPFKAYRNYFQTYVERDLRQQIQVKNLVNFENFVKILAGRISQVLNLNSISNDLGVSSTTLSEWLSVLEASYIVFRLYPYYENFGKRVVKSPKIYFTEVGLASYLLGIETTGQMSRDPLLGHLFENMVVVEALKSRLNKGLDPNIYFYRDNNKNEVDLIFQEKRKLIPIEIKSAMTFNDKMLKNIRFFQKLNTGKNGKGYLVYAGNLPFQKDESEVLNFTETYRIFEVRQ